MQAAARAHVGFRRCKRGQDACGLSHMNIQKRLEDVEDMNGNLPSKASIMNGRRPQPVAVSLQPHAYIHTYTQCHRLQDGRRVEHDVVTLGPLRFASRECHGAAVGNAPQAFVTNCRFSPPPLSGPPTISSIPSARPPARRVRRTLIGNG
ncbi:hypothetical protein LX32DRAFT_292807 [Colletotrichum zoysiae]|uniref:Uncharacterized protein n=1 Tax=Colletotrichum zoysiae TaxID=1216348 RepID=A0AAD9HKZ6_9PEZI|nr:hypothetical protein LX32DRAFT_292807 [Colletotrichum zoysiae]